MNSRADAAIWRRLSIAITVANRPQAVLISESWSGCHEWYFGTWRAILGGLDIGLVIFIGGLACIKLISSSMTQVRRVHAADDDCGLPLKEPGRCGWMVESWLEPIGAQISKTQIGKVHKAKSNHIRTSSTPHFRLQLLLWIATDFLLVSIGCSISAVTSDG